MRCATAGGARTWIVAIAEATATAIMAAALTYSPLVLPLHGSSRIERTEFGNAEPARAEFAPRGMAIAEASLTLALRALASAVDIGSLEIEVDPNETVRIRLGFERREGERDDEHRIDP